MFYFRIGCKTRNKIKEFQLSTWKRAQTNSMQFEQPSGEHDSMYSAYSHYGVTIVACASAAAFLLLVVYLLAFCTDCYKSEVSTDFHPATSHSGVKWGGAGGYTAASATSDVNDSILGAGFTSEVILPGQGNQGLPYTMIPSTVPETPGFRGYGAAPPEQGLGSGGDYSQAGYGGGGGIGGGRSQQLPGAHVSPVNVPEPEDPPPPYFSAMD